MTSDTEALHTAFAKLDGLTIWGVVAGSEYTGADFILNMGARWTIPYRVPPDSRLFGKTREVGEYNLYVKCNWRPYARRASRRHKKIEVSSSRVAKQEKSDTRNGGACYRKAGLAILNRKLLVRMRKRPDAGRFLDCRPERNQTWRLPTRN